jgi:p-aminobenzoyl-glutamate transporter AbgT
MTSQPPGLTLALIFRVDILQSAGWTKESISKIVHAFPKYLLSPLLPNQINTEVRSYLSSRNKKTGA